VSLNHGRCAGALAWVRTQILCLAASPLMASINSRALLESPPGAGAFIVTVAMRFLPRARAIASLIGPLPEGIMFQRFIERRALRTAQHAPLKGHSLIS